MVWVVLAGIQRKPKGRYYDISAHSCPVNKYTHIKRIIYGYK